MYAAKEIHIIFDNCRPQERPVYSHIDAFLLLNAIVAHHINLITILVNHNLINMKDPQLYEKAILWAKRKGFNDLKANTENYDQPSSFTRQGIDTPLIPDITGQSLGGKHYVEIAMKGESEQDTVSKWKLFSAMANMKAGKLYLLAPKGHRAFTDKLVKKYNVDATVVNI